MLFLEEKTSLITLTIMFKFRSYGLCKSFLKIHCIKPGFYVVEIQVVFDNQTHKLLFNETKIITIP